MAISFGNIPIDNIEDINTQVAPVYFPLFSWLRSIKNKYLSKIFFTDFEFILRYSINNENEVKLDGVVSVINLKNKGIINIYSDYANYIFIT